MFNKYVTVNEDEYFDEFMAFIKNFQDKFEYLLVEKLYFG